jgi:hypothetical protein
VTRRQNFAVNCKSGGGPGKRDHLPFQKGPPRSIGGQHRRPRPCRRLRRSAQFDRWSSNIIVRKVQGYPTPGRASPGTFFDLPGGATRCA